MTGRKADMSAAAAALYAELHSAGPAVPDLDNLEQYRKDVRAGFDGYVQAALDTFRGEIKDIEVAGIACKQLTPEHWSNANGRCIQYAYGGGYVSGSCYEDQIIASPLAQLCEARIVMVDYRLSPEHPYPAPQQDMRQVYPELLTQYGAARLVVCGESAGANQALGLMQHVRDMGLAMPCCAALFSPWCDLSNQGDSHIYNDGRDPTLSNRWTDIAASWHANGQALDDPGISPLYGDMRDLPPCIITTGSRDLLLSQCLRLAQKMRAADVACDLRVNEGMWHVFEFYPVPEARRSIREVADFIKAH
jgi:monoterpene epsilon-lactone hydrolase